MSLQQLFTLAFALHLEPLPTLDYAPVSISSHDSLDDESQQHPESHKVGANTRLEPIFSRHPSHNVETISFLLQYSKALEAIEPWSKLFSLLDDADHDPDFANLRQFFDARYDEQGFLIRPTNSPISSTRRFRSESRSGAINRAGRRPSQNTQARKPSFVQSISSATGFKLGWRRRDSENQSQNHVSNLDTSEDDESHRLYNAQSEAPRRAPILQVHKRSTNLSSSSDAKIARFPIRLDLHSVNLAPAPPRASQRLKSNLGQASCLPPNHLRSPVGSPDSTTSLGDPSRLGTDEPNHNHSATSRCFPHATKQGLGPPTSPTRSTSRSHSFLLRHRSNSEIKNTLHAPTAADYTPHISTGGPISNPTLPSRRELGSVTRESSLVRSGTQVQPDSTPTTLSATKHPRRPSMISKLFDLGRKKSFIEKNRNDINDTLITSSTLNLSSERKPSFLSNGTPSPSENVSSNMAHTIWKPSNFRENFRRKLGEQLEYSNEEAVDLGDEDDDEHDLRPVCYLAQAAPPPTGSRRRSSAGSSSRQHSAANHLYLEPDLRPVQEDSCSEIPRTETKSSVAAPFAPVELQNLDSLPESPLVHCDSKAPSDGVDFINLFRLASETSLKVFEKFMASEPVSEDDQGAGSDPSETPRSKLPEPSGSTTPLRKSFLSGPKSTSVSSTPKSIRSLELDRSPEITHHRQPINKASSESANDLPALNQGDHQDQEPWWPCGEIDPLPVSFAAALGQAFGWEGIMQLCYGPGSRSALEGHYAPLGRAAAIDEASKQHEKHVLAWRTGVVSAGSNPPEHDIFQPEIERATDLTTAADHKPGLEGGDPAGNSGKNNSHAKVEKLLQEAPTGNATLPLAGIQTESYEATHMDDSVNGKGGHGHQDSSGASPLDAFISKPSFNSLAANKDRRGRTWQNWMNLAKSIKGWIDEYETTRVRSGLAREIGVEPHTSKSTQHSSVAKNGHSLGVTNERRVQGDSNNLYQTRGQARDHGQPDSHQLKSPTPIASPQSLNGSTEPESTKSVKHGDYEGTESSAISASWFIPLCVTRDATEKSFGFRRRAGIPEGLPVGPEEEDLVEYSWSRKHLGPKHFATALTIAADSFSHFMDQLWISSWAHRSAWELDYMEMCVFKTPLVAERFPPTGESIVPTARSYQPSKGTLDRTKLCPNPNEEGWWDPEEWRRWLTTIKEGDIIVPAVGWQAWWTLISVLNGADRTGRSYDLQVKTLDEPFEGLTDLNAVYI